MRGAGVVIYLEQGANDLHMVQLMPLPPDHLCFSKIFNCLSFWYKLTQLVPTKGFKMVALYSPAIVVVVYCCFTLM